MTSNVCSDEALERAAAGIALLDTAGCYLFVNARYCAMLGRSRTQLLGANMQDFIHPDDLPASLDAFIRVIDTGIPLAVDQRCIRSDGSSIRVTSYVSVSAAAQATAQRVLVIAIAGEIRLDAGGMPTGAQPDLRMLLDSTADGIYCVDAEGVTTLCNAAFLRMLGFQRQEDVLGKDIHPLIHHSHPDGTPYPKEQSALRKAASTGVHSHVKDEIFFRADGSSFPVEYWVRPIVREGEIQGAACTFIDATERKQAEARQQLLNREMAHRMKNMLAMVQAIVGQSLRNAATPRDAMHSINQRLVALGHAHTALTRTRWGNASIMEVIEGAVSVHRTDGARIRIEGVRMDLGAKAALSITLALHELCTNAAKYGALSNDTGSVAIEWVVTGGAADARFRLSWQERGGPAVVPPSRKGFGSRLIADSVGADLKGTAQLLFEPAGVVWTLDAPLTAVKDSL